MAVLVDVGLGINDDGLKHLLDTAGMLVLAVILEADLVESGVPLRWDKYWCSPYCSMW